MCLLPPYPTPFQLSECEQMSSQLTSTPRRGRGKSASQGGGGWEAIAHQRMEHIGTAFP